MSGLSKREQAGRERPKPGRLARNSTMRAPTQAMRAMSDKRRELYRDVYAPLRDEAVGGGRRPCQIQSPVCTGFVEHIHEILPRGRAGGLAAALRDGDTAFVCDACNGYVSEHPVWAHANGWLKHSWEGRESGERSAR